MKKKLLSLILALLMAFSLSAAAFAGAETAVLSSQKLSVNGVDWSEVEKYNIDGKNYFKLRDIAALLDYTEAKFAVGFDSASNTVSITRGGAYEYVGTELFFEKDNSKTAVVSAQTITVDGKKVTGLTAYNIGGSNFFQLRELGELLGFEVGYDDATRTVLVSSPYNTYLMTKNTTVSDGVTIVNVYEYDSHGWQTRVSTTVSSGYSTVYECAYDARGNVTLEKNYTNGSQDDQTISEYDVYGNLVLQEYKNLSSGYTSSMRADYRSDGQPNWIESSDSDGFWGRAEYTYNNRGDLTKSVVSDLDGSSTTTYTTDSQGRTLSEKTVYSGGRWSSYTYTYSGDLLMREAWLTSEGYSSSVDYRYNADGMPTYIKSVTDHSTQIDTYEYTAEGWLKKNVSQVGDVVYTTEYTYNEFGYELSVTTTSNTNDYYQVIYKYNDSLELIEEKHTSNTSVSTYTYTYDSNGNMISYSYTDNDGYSARTAYEYRLVTIEP